MKRQVSDQTAEQDGFTKRPKGAAADVSTDLIPSLSLLQGVSHGADDDDSECFYSKMLSSTAAFPFTRL